ncbi:MAG: DNA polymerase III subunit chi [Gammaproteobacteria bacterium]|jgi:DNA polymerase-3 subunit chi|nr:DNA polymerase III subunit chi [Gammaproteobacteria bacterium]
MARADFYRLKESHGDDRYRLLQQLLSKSVSAGQRVHIHCRDGAEAAHLDDYIWAFKPESFLPHHQLGQDHKMQSPITLGHKDLWPEQAEICINFSAAPVDGFARIIEIVVQQPDILQQTRDHYRHYQQQGLEMHVHKL